MAKAPKTGDKSANPKQKAATTAHLLETTAHQLAHSQRHLESLKTSKGSAKQLDMEHLDTHLKGGVEHVQKLMSHVKSNYPAEGKELKNLEVSVAHANPVTQKIHEAHMKVRTNK